MVIETTIAKECARARYMTNSSSTRPVLACESVSKRFAALTAVDDLSFEVGEGEVLGIGGPNGAGKTTLFDLVSGLVPLDGGRVVLDGRDVGGQPPYRLCQAGIARTFQLNAGFDTLTVRENVLLAAQYGVRSSFLPPLRFSRHSIRLADEALEFVGLADRRDQEVATLRVFDRKLLMIAGAVATEPRVILMDEPVGGLTPGEIDAVIELVEHLRNRGMTIVLIEHVMRFLVRLSDRVMIMHHGQSIYEGTPEGLSRDRQVVEVYLGEAASRALQQPSQDADAERSGQ